jgi:hypothetical protein
VPGSDREFVDADDLGAGTASPIELLLHVELVEILDRVPVEVPVLGHVLDGGQPTVAADADGEALREVGVVGQPVEAFAFHGLAHPTGDAPDRALQVDAAATAVEVADSSRGLIVEGAMAEAAHTADGFFRRRRRVMTTASGSPKTPRMVAAGSKPGNEYNSRSRVKSAMRPS